MPSRHLLAAAVLAAAVATLTSCTSAGTSTTAAPGPATTAAPATPPAATASTSPARPPVSSAPVPATPSPSASQPGDLPLDPEPSFDCTAEPLPAGHRVVQVTGTPAGGVLQARVAEFTCDPNGGGYTGTGVSRRFPLAPGVTAELSAAGSYRRVSLVGLGEHISTCLHHGEVQPPLSCSGDLYEITLTGSGAVSDIREIWHP